MDNEIQLISDEDGLAVIGNPADIDAFLSSEGLPSKSLPPNRLRSLLDAGAFLAQTGSDLSAGSAQWMKLTPESAKLVQKYGLRRSATSGCGTGVLKGKKGQIKGFVEFTKSPRTFVTNPATLANAATIMNQLAMQQNMEEITDYLARIDEKVDDVLRAQKDAVLSRMIGVGFVIEEAMTLRDSRGRVDEVTWSKVQTAPTTIAETQAYALRQLDAIAEKVESKSKIGDLVTTAKGVETKAREWMAVLARCFQLQEAIAVLELDRVLDSSPEELDAHRLGLKAARTERLDHIARTTGRLLARMDAAIGTANSKVLLHPSKSPEFVRSGNHVVTGVHDLHELLGIGSGGESSEARRWLEAALDVRDKALETGAKGVGTAKSIGVGSLDRANSAKGRLSNTLAERARRLRGNEEERGEQA
ncbi:hypothetical protein [Streptomyces sp. NPDC058867]|uniref:hypothetical protein n=1 Tax=unclassified Streptomyces TaxID=2593676 RepID=UPI0036AA47ED